MSNIDKYFEGVAANALSRIQTIYGKKSIPFPEEYVGYINKYFEMLKNRLMDLNVTRVFLDEDDTLFLREYFGIVDSNSKLDLNRVKTVGAGFSSMVLEDINAKIKYVMSICSSSNADAFSEYPIGLGELGLSSDIYSYLHTRGINLIIDFFKKSKNIIFSIPGIDEQEANAIIDLIHSKGGFFADDQELFVSELHKLVGVIGDLTEETMGGKTLTHYEMAALMPNIKALSTGLKRYLLIRQDSVIRHRK